MKRQRAEVEAIKRELEGIRDNMRQQLSVSETDSVHALSSYDNHPADLATDTFFREINLGLAFGTDDRLAEVARALQKLDEGSYGLCDRCHRAIPSERLAARPETIWCRECAETVVPGYVAPPSEVFVLSHLGDTMPETGVEPDGEDIGQDLWQWGSSDTPQDTPPAVDYEETFVGFDEPVGVVSDVEGIIDESGEVLWDTLRAKSMRSGDSVERQSEDVPEDFLENN